MLRGAGRLGLLGAGLFGRGMPVNMRRAAHPAIMDNETKASTPTPLVRLRVNPRGALAAAAMMAVLLVAAAVPETRPWAAPVVGAVACWWLKEIDDAAVRRRMGRRRP